MDQARAPRTLLRNTRYTRVYARSSRCYVVTPLTISHATRRAHRLQRALGLQPAKIGASVPEAPDTLNTNGQCHHSVPGLLTEARPSCGTAGFRPALPIKVFR